MGNLYGVEFGDLVQKYALDSMVETGTGHGHNLIAALQRPELVDLRSIEIDEETHRRARVTFAQERRVGLYLGDSPAVLPTIARSVTQLGRRVLWFLDAHFPGSGRITPLPMTVAGPDDGAKKVPIVAELQALRAHRDLARDVIIIDDLGLFEAGPFEHDPHQLRAALGFQSIDWLSGLLEPTHEVRRSYRDGGYLIALPKS